MERVVRESCGKCGEMVEIAVFGGGMVFSHFLVPLGTLRLDWVLELKYLSVFAMRLYLVNFELQ